jgi:hypothetical protein
MGSLRGEHSVENLHAQSQRSYSERIAMAGSCVSSVRGDRSPNGNRRGDCATQLSY